MDKYKEEIKQKISVISDKGKILFAALTTERLLPNYAFFQKQMDWGNLEFLSEGISLAYQFLFKEELFSSSEIEELIENVDNVTPDTEDFSEVTTSFALDACSSVYSILKYLLEHNSQYIADVATYARDTIDMFIQEKFDLKPSDPQREEKIANDPLMLSEKKRQRDLLDKLKTLNLDNISDELIESLRDNTPIIELEIFEE